MKVDVIDQKNTKVGDVDLPDHIFKARWNPDLVHQALSTQLANRRVKLAQVKGRGEVRGGGKKPWKQKGTGRARQGSIRSPLWKGGGISFGPRNARDFSQKINKKMVRNALQGILTKKLSLGICKVVRDLDTLEVKTKAFARMAQNLTGGKSALLVVANDNIKALQASANLPQVKGVRVKDMNVYDALTHAYVLIEE